MNNLDRQYNSLVQDIIDNGTWVENRTGVRTKTVFGRMIRHNMSEGFPLLTTRKLPIKSTWVELEGFINGITDKQWYQDRGCKFWDLWCCPTLLEGMTKEEKQEKSVLNKDLGPIYGYQWRKFGECYFPDEGLDGLAKGYDQLWNIVENIRIGNDNRRLICSAWNPNQLHLMALPPCHMFFQVNILDDKLNLMWYQRSCDVACGIPQNISSYATLLILLAKEGNLTPGELTGVFGNFHIYENHLEQLKIQIERPLFYLPSICFEEYGDIFSWTHDKCKILNYQAGEKIKYEVVQ